MKNNDQQDAEPKDERTKEELLRDRNHDFRSLEALHVMFIAGSQMDLEELTEIFNSFMSAEIRLIHLGEDVPDREQSHQAA